MSSGSGEDPATSSGGRAASTLGSKLWGGRFSSGPSECMHAFNRSVSFDQRLGSVDVQGSIAYASALLGAGLLSADEHEEMQRGLAQLMQEWGQNSFVVSPQDEDVHSANERRLHELIGEIALKLHTGRSRNDQVATDLRLFTLEAFRHLERGLRECIRSMTNVATRDIDVLMPAYTHVQRAQPIRFSHWLLSHAWPLRRDFDRLAAAADATSSMPLGSGACAGIPFAVDRIALSQSLEFQRISSNSIDAVSDRDFVADFLYCCSMIQMHLSRFAEDMILYCSQEFSFVRVSDAFSTGSSLMPQKRNPDGLELLRGKAGRVLGSLLSLLTTLKGLPSAYNKDLQEDKEPLFDAYDTVLMSLEIARGVVDTMTVDRSKTESALSMDMLSTDIAYYLVRKGVAFRNAHHLSGQVVSLAEKNGVSISDLTLEQFQSVSALFESDVSALFEFENSVEQYAAPGGTGRRSVLDQIDLLQNWLQTSESQGIS